MCKSSEQAQARCVSGCPRCVNISPAAGHLPLDQRLYNVRTSESPGAFVKTGLLGQPPGLPVLQSGWDLTSPFLTSSQLMELTAGAWSETTP